MYTATYSPDDNKLRLYASGRLPAELYQRVRAHGFIWAPKQDLFVAPAWSPEREDFLIDLCGEIEDEDKSLVERAEERAERFEDYSEKRAEDAERARAGVAAIADNIPLGQPILVGHHSERHARKDAERIENGMRKTVKMWETSKYWTSRAKGAISHAKYKELPGVRARRIKGLEADKRSHERGKKQAEFCLDFWEGRLKLKSGGFLEVNTQNARNFANHYDHIYVDFKLADYPRNPPASQYEGSQSLWSALGEDAEHAIITVDQARAIAVPIHSRTIENNIRWLAHLENRLAYEKAMLEEQGESGLLIPKPRPALLPLLNYRQSVFVLKNPYSRGETLTYNQIDMLAAEYAKIHSDYKGTRIVENSHRIRTAMVKHALVAVFLTDSKVHEKPEPTPPAPPPSPKPVKEITEGRTIWNSDGTDGPALICMPPEKPKPEPTGFGEVQKNSFEDEMKAIEARLKAGVKVVVANQLFPTPPLVAKLMVEYADIKPGNRILEPSAGTGNILAAMGGRMFDEPSDVPYRDRDQLYAVEINHDLAARLRHHFPLTHVKCDDFLTCNGDLGKFDRIVMNPPFENGSDIKHIQHALTMLKPGGRIVAICANGPRQNEKLRPIASEWEELPEGTFDGTGVRAVLLTIEG